MTQLQDKNLLSRFGKYATFSNASYAIIFFLCLIVGLFPAYNRYLSIILFIVVCLNIKSDDFFIYMVIFLFFGEQFYLTSASTVYRFYSYLLLAKIFFQFNKLQIRVVYIPAFLVIVCFCVFSVSRLSMFYGFKLITDVTLGFLAYSRIAQNQENMRKMTAVFVIAALLSGVYSFTSGAIVEYDTAIGTKDVSIKRYYGTMVDANYAGFFFDIAIFMALCSDAFKKWYLRVPILFVLYLLLMLTGSMTALLCNALGIAFYLVLRFKMKSVPYLAAIGILGLGLLLGILYVPAFMKYEVFRNLNFRITQQLMFLRLGQIANLLSDRTYLWDYAWNYFLQLPLLNKLIGGSVVTSYITQEPLLSHTVGGSIHQTYLQGLLDFGILGSIIIFGTKILKFIRDTFSFLKSKNMPIDADLMRIALLSGYVWLFYALTIDYFVDWRFMFFYFY